MVWAMYHTLAFTNLRGVREAEVTDIAPLTVVVGPNNSGKSTLLEAFYLAAAGPDAGAMLDIMDRRGWCGEASVEQVLMAASQPFVVSATSSDHKEPTVFFVEAGWAGSEFAPTPMEALTGNVWSVRAEHSSGRSIVYVDQDFESTDVAWQSDVVHGSVRLIDVGTITDFGQLEESYSNAVDHLREPQLEALVQKLLGRPARLRILKKGSRHVLHVIDDQQAVAIYHMGDGFKRLLYLACVFAEAEGQLVLLEEPEAFQHPRYVAELAQLIWGAVEQGTQVMLSTHSEDLLSGLFGQEDANYDLAAVMKTRLTDGILKTVRIDGAEAHERVTELAEDLRR